MPIPKIIHQTNATRKLPGIYRAGQKLLIDLHPDWEYRFYDDIECRNTVERYVPDLLPVYDNYPANIQRVDLFRIVAIYAIGGFYLDLDIVCFKKLDKLCPFNCVFGEEKTLTRAQTEELGHRDSVRVANYMFGSEPGHPFLLHILNEIIKRGQKKIVNEDDVLESTGPGLITTVYHDCKKHYRNIVLLPNRDRKCPSPYCGGAVSCHFGNFAAHLHLGSWRWGIGKDFNPNVPAEKEPLSDSFLYESPGKPRINCHDLLWANQGQCRSAGGSYTKALSRIQLEINKIAAPGDIFVLETYGDEQYDGLTPVFQKITKIGVLKNETRSLQNAKVLVIGIPFLYVDKISSENTNIIYTTFESHRMPSFWVEAINKYYDYCIVPHSYIRAVFENSGVNIPVKAIHQGFTRYKRMNLNTRIVHEFRIGYWGIPVNRKNLRTLIQACLNLENRIPGIKLHIHVPEHYDWIDKDLIGSDQCSSIVKWTDGRLSEDEIARWYNNLSCHIVPSSDQGWSFTPKESLYLAIPTIISNLPVFDKLVESGFYKVIFPKGHKETKTGVRIERKWNTIETADIETAIFEVYKNYSYFRGKAVEGSRWIEDRWTNEETQQWVLQLLHSI